MRFGFLLKPEAAEASRVAAELAGVVRQRGHATVIASEEASLLPDATRVPIEELGSAVDVLIVLGGDGTFLRAASLVADGGVPLLGINLGGLGFLTPYGLAEARAAALAACEGRLPIEERMRLRVTVLSGGQVVDTRSALNEAVVQRSGPRLLDLQADLNGEVITTYKADGLILSTPTGSTAYSLAAGGPILAPDLEAVVLTPICPHTFTNRPVVMRADALLRVTNMSAHPVTLTVDGRGSRELSPNDAVEVAKALRPLRVFRQPSTFFAMLRKKLSWGERQN